MWIISGVLFALSSPYIRDFLEKLFADLVLWFHSILASSTILSMFGAMLSFTFFMVLFQNQFKKSCLSMHQGSPCKTKAVTSINWKQRSMALAATTSILLPTGIWGISIPADMRTKCEYSSSSNCIKNPQRLKELGTFKKGVGFCSTMGEANVKVEFPSVWSKPPIYNPISTEDAYHKEKQKNKFSEWSENNQLALKTDCSYLYDESIVKDGNDYLCCTEKQFEGLSTQLSRISGNCESCNQGLKNMWCQMACNPSNSLFVDVKEVEIMKDEDDPSKEIVASEYQTYSVSEPYIQNSYAYCKGSGFTKLICGSCTNAKELVDFMGEYKFNLGIGSPLKVEFQILEDMTTEDVQNEICPCDSLDNPVNCTRPLNTKLQDCSSCGANCEYTGILTRDKACFGDRSFDNNSNSPSSKKKEDPLQNLWTSLDENIEETDFTIFNYVLISFTCFLIVVVLIWLTCVATSLDLSVLYKCRRLSTTPIENSSTTTNDLGNSDPEYIGSTDTLLKKSLGNWGAFVARRNNSFFVIIAGLIFIIICGIGLIHLETETDPIALWVSPSSTVYQERDRYGKLFGPFYRTQQIILTAKNGGSVFQSDLFEQAIVLQEKISQLVSPDGVRLDDVCWQAVGKGCTVNSITQFFQNNLTIYKAYGESVRNQTLFCLSNPTSSNTNLCRTLDPKPTKECDCFSNFGIPMYLFNTYLGKYPNDVKNDTSKYMESKSMVISYLLKNNYDASENSKAISWERSFIKFMKEFVKDTDNAFNAAFMAEISVQDELDRSSHGSVLPALLSYLLMLVYVTIGLGKWSFSKKFWIEAKFSVGFFGVIVVVFSVISTIGIFQWFGIKVQLIIAEVVPFLTLAIGVDNIFLLVHGASKAQEAIAHENLCFPSVEDHVIEIISRALKNMGPSIVLASIAECIAFSFGCISPMPAVLYFAAYSAVAVLVNLILQMTIFVAILVLDKRRELDNRVDILCCIGRRNYNSSTNVTMDHDTGNLSRRMSSLTETAESFANRAIDVYAKILSKNICKAIILISFIIFTSLSIYSSQSILPGLPQEEAMPSDSYLINYFHHLKNDLEVGAPVYFVVEGGHKNNSKSFSLYDNSIAKKFCTSHDFCEKNSVGYIIKGLRERADPEISRIGDSESFVLYDEYWSFARPNGICCKVNTTSNLIMPSGLKTSNSIESCLSGDLSNDFPPVEKEKSMAIFKSFSQSPAGIDCQSGGASKFSGQISLNQVPYPNKTSEKRIFLNNPYSNDELSGFTYMVLSKACRTEKDFINTYRQSKRISEYMTQETGINIWSYSIFFAFFDQYLNIYQDTFLLVGLAILAIWLVQMIYFTAIIVPFFVMITIISTCIWVAGFMEPFDIMLNGLSLVNLVICAGVSVEFTSHFARAFLAAKGTNNERMRIALHKVMLSVIFGITVTKLVGLSALTLADSRIFKKYYFRMYMAVVLSGVLHGMVLLPVLLSIVAPSNEKKTNSNLETETLVRVTPAHTDFKEFTSNDNET